MLLATFLTCLFSALIILALVVGGGERPRQHKWEDFADRQSFRSSFRVPADNSPDRLRAVGGLSHSVNDNAHNGEDAA